MENGKALKWVRVTLIFIGVLVALTLVVPIMVDMARDDQVTQDRVQFPGEGGPVDPEPHRHGVGEPVPAPPAE